MTTPLHERTPRLGPCRECGMSGPNGLFTAPSDDEVCARCLDDVTGESARHSTPHPAR